MTLDPKALAALTPYGAASAEVAKAELQAINGGDVAKRLLERLRADDDICGFKPDRITADEIVGGRLRWIAYDEPECAFCEGKGESVVRGRNGKSVVIDCPECDDYDPEGTTFEFSTNMDGKNIKAYE